MRRMSDSYHSGIKWAKRFVRRVFQRVVRPFPTYRLVPPYEYVQRLVEARLHEYLGRRRAEIESVYIIGGYLGREIPRLLKTYPSAHITVFEPSERYKDKLRKRFGSDDRVDIQGLAVSDETGTAPFYETTLRGSGSLLKLGELAAESYAARSAESFQVSSTTLDSFCPSDARIDCLWIDVQGAELRVLQGASRTLSGVDSVFLEVSVNPGLYLDGATLREVHDFLTMRGFVIALLGLDHKNLTGNALYVRSSSATQ